jgi:hypothetical protein
MSNKFKFDYTVDKNNDYINVVDDLSVINNNDNNDILIRNIDDVVDDLVDITLDDLLNLIDDSLNLNEVNNKVYKKFVKAYGKKKAKAVYYATANKQGRDPETWEFAKKENTTGSVGGYNTPNAFIDVTEKELENEFDYNKYYGEKAPKIDSNLKADNKYKKLKTEGVEIDIDIKEEYNDLIDEFIIKFNEVEKIIKQAVKFKIKNELGQEHIKQTQFNKLINLKQYELIMLLNNLSA